VDVSTDGARVLRSAILYGHFGRKLINHYQAEKMESLFVASEFDEHVFHRPAQNFDLAKIKLCQNGMECTNMQ
jgi:hypothetical protein